MGRFRSRFAIPPGIYLDGNSLGPLPLSARDAIEDALEEWGRAGVQAWPRWIDRPLAVGDLLGTAVLGAAPGEVVVCDSTTVNLFKLASAALDARPERRRVLVMHDEFPTDRYVLEGLAGSRGLDLQFVEDERALVAGLDEDTALAVISLVDYRSGALADLAGVTEAGRRAGALILWDLSHAAGIVPVELGRAGADLAVGCTYKYLNSGPGAPAYLYVRRQLQAALRSPIQGWFGQQGQFAMGPAYDPAPDMRRWLAGTPSILGLAAVEAGAALVAEAGVASIRAKSLALTSLATALSVAWLQPLGCTLASPADPARRGGHVSIRHPNAWQLTQALSARAQVIVDFRPPDVVRLGFTPLVNQFVEVWDGCDALRGVLERGDHLTFDSEPGRVT